MIVVWGHGAWGSDSAIPDYSQAVANTRVVAKQTKMVIDMMERQGALLKQIHMIGHSLGAHTSGHIGYLLKPENKTLGRITGKLFFLYYYYCCFKKLKRVVSMHGLPY